MTFPRARKVSAIFFVCSGARDMAEITAAAVMALREKTGLPMMECKKALAECGGNTGR